MVKFEARESDLMHDDYPMIFHVIQNGKAKVTFSNGSVNESEIPFGFIGYNFQVKRHQVTNIGDNQVKNLLVEHFYQGSKK